MDKRVKLGVMAKGRSHQPNLIINHLDLNLTALLKDNQDGCGYTRRRGSSMELHLMLEVIVFLLLLFVSTIRLKYA